MAFFARRSDPMLGGTYMTMLNTLANLGNMWPATAALARMADRVPAAKKVLATLLNDEREYVRAWAATGLEQS